MPVKVWWAQSRIAERGAIPALVGLLLGAGADPEGALQAAGALHNLSFAEVGAAPSSASLSQQQLWGCTV
jgi:hypothetical protein